MDWMYHNTGRKALSLEEKRKLGGGYNSLLQTSLPENLRCYNPAEETADSSHVAFTTAFPRGFAVEIVRVYSGPPVIVYQFRHWGYKEGPFKGHAATGEMVQLFGMSVFEVTNTPIYLLCARKKRRETRKKQTYIYFWFLEIWKLQLDDQEKIVKVEFFYDRGELLGGLLKGASLADSPSEAAASSCPFLKNTG